MKTIGIVGQGFVGSAVYAGFKNHFQTETFDLKKDSTCGSLKELIEKHAGGVANYRASEGKTVQLPYRGDLNATIQDILGGVRSTCTYVGAAKLKELSKRTTFIRVTQQVNNVFGAEKK